MDSTRMPARVSPPGRILKLELDARGWTQKDLAEIIGRPKQVINEIVMGKKQITPETAVQLADAFGTSAELWINLETQYRLWLAKKSHKTGLIERMARLYDLLPIPEIRRKGWIKNVRAVDKLEKEVMTFLQITSLDESPKCSVSFRHSGIRTPEVMSQIAWVKRVEHLIRNQKAGRFDRAKLRKAIPALLECSANEQDFDQIPQMMLNLGIHFAIVPHLEKTYLDGALFYYEGNPVIALTLRYKRLDYFWFTLMHELAHLIAGHKGNFLDTLYDHRDDLSEVEAEADRLAADLLLDPKTYAAFLAENRLRFTRKAIREFASKCKRHPAIVLGRLQYDKEVGFDHLRSLLGNVESVTAKFFDVPVAA